MKTLRALVASLIVAAAAGTVASAAPIAYQAVLSADDTPVESAESTEESTTEGDSTEESTTEESTTEGDSTEEDSTEESDTTDGWKFEDCVGMTGLENAHCRVSANYEDHHNAGLENAAGKLADKIAAGSDEEGSAEEEGEDADSEAAEEQADDSDDAGGPGNGKGKANGHSKH